MTVGECIKSLRTAAGLMQLELADRVGISASMLSLVEAGKREPTISLLRAIGRALGIPTSVLFAVALADDEVARTTPAAQSARKLTSDLVDAAVNTLRAKHRPNNLVRRRSGRRSA